MKNGIRVVVDPEVPVNQSMEHKKPENFSYENEEQSREYNRLRDVKRTNSDLGGTDIRDQISHGLLFATHKSFCLHLPLVLKPDHIAITIMQSLSLAINQNPEQFKTTLGAAKDALKKQLTVNLGQSSQSENVWNRAFDNFRIAISEEFGDHIVSHGLCDYSTSCWATRNVSNIVLMDTYSSVAEFKVRFYCGIPIVHLLGTKEDWDTLFLRVKRLSAIFQSLEWWFERLIPVIENIVNLWSGEPNTKWWKSFYSYRNSSGGHHVTGHINALFPYVHDRENNSKYVKNPSFVRNNNGYFETVSYKHFPKMVTEVNFIKEEFNVQTKCIAKANFIQTAQVFDIGVMPLCDWCVIEEGNVIAKGTETLPDNPDNNESDNPDDNGNEEKEQKKIKMTVEQTAPPTAFRSRVLLPCYCLFSVVAGNVEEEHNVPPTCPTCGEKVTKSVKAM